MKFNKTDIEIWKSVPNFDYYEVSNTGKVRSLDRTIYVEPCERYPNGYTKTIKGKELIPEITKNGYTRIVTCGDDTYKRWLIHRLVALVFLENPNNYKEINHKDENKSNNNLYNLEWCDRCYNRMYGTGHQRRIDTKSIEIDQYDLNNNFIKTWKSIKSAAISLNKNSGDIIGVCKGYRKSAFGFIWKYKN